MVPGSDLALVTGVRGDNSGPHKPEEIDRIHAELAARFPHAEIVATNLSEMANALAPYRDKLPVVKEEIGDTWIYGCASDPLKVARFRELSRLREAWIGSGALKVGDATDLQLLRHVLLEPEHTWGTDTKTWLDYDNLIPSDLAGELDTKNYKVVEFSWIEKRQDLLDGIATLPEAQREEALLAIESVKATRPVVAPNAMATVPGKAIETAHFTLQIDAKTGAITRLRNKATGRQWATEKNPIALLTYQTLSQEDYTRYRASYVISKADWAQKDFGKPNIELFGAKRQEWHPGFGRRKRGRNRRGASYRGELAVQGRGGILFGPRRISAARFCGVAAAQCRAYDSSAIFRGSASRPRVCPRHCGSHLIPLSKTSRMEDGKIR